jgi:hypothetical protein
VIRHHEPAAASEGFEVPADPHPHQRADEPAQECAYHIKYRI